MSGGGYIRAYRSIVDSWEHRHNPLMVASWLFILMRTAWEETEVDGVLLHPGEVIVSKGMLANQYGLTLRQAAWIIKRLVSSGELELLASRGRNAPVYRLCNYADYNSQGMSAKWPQEWPQEWPQIWPQKWPLECPQNVRKIPKIPPQPRARTRVKIPKKKKKNL